jgi:hypothetical protein
MKIEMIFKKSFLHTHLSYLIYVFLVLGTFAVYSPVRNHAFVNFDDDLYVTRNSYVRAGLTFESISWAFTTTITANWHPLTWMSHMMDCQLYGMNAGLHHLTNVFFHIANTLLLFLILKMISGNSWRSGFVAALFAVHPLHVESVAWVAERKDVLSTFFWMLAMWSYGWYVRCPGISRYLLIVLFFVLGLMAKPMLVTLPFVFLLLDYWPLGRFQYRQSRPGQLSVKGSPYFRLTLEKIPFFVLAAGSSVLTFIVQETGGAVASLHGFPLHLRIANALVSYISYIGKMIWPQNLGVFYPHPVILPWWKVAGSGVLLTAVSVLVIRSMRRRPYLAVGWLWYIGTLIPVIGLVQIGMQGMADRYTYIPIIGLFIIIAWGAPEVVSRWRLRETGLATMAVLIVSIFMATTFLQLRYWENSITLFEHALAVTSRNYVAHDNLGSALFTDGRIDEAIDHYTEALRINPDYLESHNNLGAALFRKGRIDEAINYYMGALRIKPDLEEAHNNLGAALFRKGKIDEAIAHFREAIRIRPDYTNAQNNLKSALAARNKLSR